MVVLLDKDIFIDGEGHTSELAMIYLSILFLDVVFFQGSLPYFSVTFILRLHSGGSVKIYKSSKPRS